MRVSESELPGVLIIDPDVFHDERGYFMETWHAARYAKQGLPGRFVQDNHSHSRKGVLRGLHYQLHNPQGKLVRVAHGEVFDVAVDIRKGSPSFGRWAGITLSAANHRQLYIPPGFAHGFCVLSDSAEFLYKCTEFYVPGDEYGLAWNDPDIAIEWPVTDVQLSDKDASNPLLKDLDETLPRYTES